MLTSQKGWVVVNIGHPRTGNSYIVAETFSATRTNAIKQFINGSDATWRYWRDKWNFRVVRSKQTVFANLK